MTRLGSGEIPVLVGFPKCKDDVWILAHHCPSREVHELESTNVIRLHKSMIVRESVASGGVVNWWALKGVE